MERRAWLDRVGRPRLPVLLHPGAVALATVILAGLVVLGSIRAGPSGPVLGFVLGLAGSLLVQHLVAEDKRQKLARVARECSIVGARSRNLDEKQRAIV